MPGHFDRDGLSVIRKGDMKVIKTDKCGVRSVLLIAEAEDERCGELVLVYLKAKYTVFLSLAKTQEALVC